MSFPSKPPTPDFKWPSKWEDWQWDFIEWCESRQPMPNQNDFDVDELPHGVGFSLKPSAVLRIAQAVIFPLQLVDASTGGDAIIRVRLGFLADLIADPAMTSPSDDPPYTTTLGSDDTYVIRSKLTCSYDTNVGIWTIDDGEIVTELASSPTAPDATTIYVDLGSATRVTDAGSSSVSVISQNVSGNQGVSRTGNAGTYVDNYWLI